jgi:glucose-6-phosphate-specific signal transduction histidine kinase
VLVDNRRLAQENLRIQEIERKHLARELHDELGQYVNAIKLDAVSIRETGGREPELSTNAALSIMSTALSAT